MSYAGSTEAYIELCLDYIERLESTLNCLPSCHECDALEEAMRVLATRPEEL